MRSRSDPPIFCRALTFPARRVGSSGSQNGARQCRLADHLLLDQPRNVPLAMRERGYTHEHISEAWTAACAARTPNRPGSAGHALAKSLRSRSSFQAESASAFSADQRLLAPFLAFEASLFQKTPL